MRNMDTEATEAIVRTVFGVIATICFLMVIVSFLHCESLLITLTFVINGITFSIMWFIMYKGRNK